AAYMLATTRSFRTSSERDLVNWHADSDPIFARLAGEVHRSDKVTKLELLIAGIPGQPATESVRRRARVNGHDTPLLHLLGHLNAVLFSPEDVDLVAGPAERRRRYLDITLSQVDHRYVRTLRRYLRILTQRNALLKLSRDRSVPPDEFEYWDAQLTETGAALLLTRLRAVATLNRELRAIYPTLTDQPAPLTLEYRSSVPLEDFLPPDPGGRAGDDGAEAELARRFTSQLAALAPRERAQGVTLSGLHRDDVAFTVDGVDLRTYGSRGQQRLGALALKLAETAFMRASTGDQPLLLLDDVMSELDPTRRQHLQSAISGHDQVLMTATELLFFDQGLLANAARYRVASGTVTREQ
ncbi:MAG TPA: DNA replication and repair protein RecF, partial [Chloroflexota bacterium]|nr:DNA replication and repair protein RecF [Chloroflexota bacterium]